MRATQDKTFHLSCFTCLLCNHAMRVGETYFLGDAGALYCHSKNNFKKHTYISLSIF